MLNFSEKFCGGIQNTIRLFSKTWSRLFSIFRFGLEIAQFWYFFQNSKVFSEFWAIFESRVGEIPHFLWKMKIEQGTKQKHCYPLYTTNFGSKKLILRFLVLNLPTLTKCKMAVFIFFIWYICSIQFINILPWISTIFWNLLPFGCMLYSWLSFFVVNVSKYRQKRPFLMPAFRFSPWTTAINISLRNFNSTNIPTAITP